MPEFLISFLALIRKEVLMIVKDKQSRMILVMPILMQTLLFGYVTTFDLNNVKYAVLDEDRSFASRELISSFDGSPIFIRVQTLDNSSGIAHTIDSKKAVLVLYIEQNFEAKLSAGQNASVQILVDGRNSNVAGTAMGYAVEVVSTYNTKRMATQNVGAPSVQITSRSWFNPNLETRWNIMASMVAVMVVVQVLLLASQAVAREKEFGTLEQLLITPYTPFTIMLGKALPSVFVGLLQSSIILPISIFWFKIPFVGSYTTLYLGLILFTFSIVGIGLCISVISNNMQQALLYTFSLLMPMILLSGFLTPVDSMPTFFQYATLLNPIRYGVTFAQRVYLEGATLGAVSELYLILLAMAIVTLSGAAWLFKNRLG